MIVNILGMPNIAISYAFVSEIVYSDKGEIWGALGNPMTAEWKYTQRPDAQYWDLINIKTIWRSGPVKSKV
jgi:hypothetical protein